MGQILEGLPGTAVYLDDILVAGRTMQEAKDRLLAVLQRLHDHNVRIYLSKSRFLQTSVEYVGHGISSKGITTTQSHFEAVKSLQPPKTFLEIQKFLRLLNYYHHHLYNIATIARPLYDLKLETFYWGHEQQLAFEKCKKCFLDSPALTPYDPDKPIFLITDASPYGTSAVLCHLDEYNKEHPVFFTSKTLNSAQRNYPHHEREALAITHGVTKFHKYLFGRKFIIYTDNKPTVSLLYHKKSIPVLAKMRLQRWSIILGAYDYEIKFRKVSEIILADYLSRNPLDEVDTAENEINHVELFRDQTVPLNLTDVAIETQKDPLLHKIYQIILRGWPEKCPGTEYIPFFNKMDLLSVDQNCIMLGERVVIPVSLQNHVLNLLHTGHPGIVRTKMLARSLLWWPEIECDIVKLLQNCEPCQAIRNAEPSSVQSWTKTIRRMQRLHFDFT
jgi:hypothetical protein